MRDTNTYPILGPWSKPLLRRLVRSTKIPVGVRRLDPNLARRGLEGLDVKRCGARDI